MRAVARSSVGWVAAVQQVREKSTTVPARRRSRPPALVHRDPVPARPQPRPGFMLKQLPVRWLYGTTVAAALRLTLSR